MLHSSVFWIHYLDPRPSISDTTLLFFIMIFTACLDQGHMSIFLAELLVS